MDALKAEAIQFRKLVEEDMIIQPGSKWFVVAASWFKAWKLYVGDSDESINMNTKLEINGVEQPGIIANADLLEPPLPKFLQDPDQTLNYENTFLKTSLLENDDYVVIPERAYTFLKAKYDVDVEIERKPI
jgi:hypothetical protein